MTKFRIESLREALIQIRVEQSQYITESISKLENNNPNFDRTNPHGRAVVSAIAHAGVKGYEFDSTRKSNIKPNFEHSIIPLKHKKTGKPAEMMVNGSHPGVNPNYRYTLDIHNEDGESVHSMTIGGEEGEKRAIPDQPNRSGKLNPRLR